MAKSAQGDAVDNFILDRWAQSRDLSGAFRSTMKKMRRRLRTVGQQLQGPLRAQGYEVYLEEGWAEFKAYRPEWCSEPEEPLVVVAVGGVFPVGYFGVSAPAAYLALYLEGFEEDQPALYRQFADVLYHELGGLPAAWQDRTGDDDWNTPLWAELSGFDDNKRVALARNPQELKSFALEQYGKFFEIGDAVTRAVQRFAAR